MACNTKVSLCGSLNRPVAQLVWGAGQGAKSDVVEVLCDLEGGPIWHLCNVFPTHNVSFP